MESLHSWTEVLREHVHSLKLPPKELNEMEERSKFILILVLAASVWTWSIKNNFTSEQAYGGDCITIDLAVKCQTDQDTFDTFIKQLILLYGVGFSKV